MPGHTEEDAKRCARECIAEAAVLDLLDRVAFVLLDGLCDLFLMLDEFSEMELTSLHDYLNSSLLSKSTLSVSWSSTPWRSCIALLSNFKSVASARDDLQTCVEGCAPLNSSRFWRCRKT